MTSKENHDQVVHHFKENQFFGCNPNQIAFFPQGELPFLQENGSLFLENSNTIAFGPDGNGSCFKAFINSKIASTWKNQGIEYITFMPIDNLLADPFDPVLIGYHAAQNVDATIKAIPRENSDEKVGIIIESVRDGDENSLKAEPSSVVYPKVNLKNSPDIIPRTEETSTQILITEYSEMEALDFIAKNEDGTYLYSFANTGLFCFSFPFFIKASEKNLPLHKALKPVKDLGYAWKFERFIFDILTFATSTQVILYPRKRCFAPLKDKESIPKVQEALIQFNQEIFKEATGRDLPLDCQEIDPIYYYTPM